jgi:hypothetical protein
VVVSMETRNNGKTASEIASEISPILSVVVLILNMNIDLRKI